MVAVAINSVPTSSSTKCQMTRERVPEHYCWRSIEFAAWHIDGAYGHSPACPRHWNSLIYFQWSGLSSSSDELMVAVKENLAAN